MKAQAANTNDWSELSDANIDGAIIQIIPFKMQIPTRGYSTSITTLYIDWLALTGDDTGSAAIDSYNLVWDAGTDGVTFSDLIGADPYSTATSGIFTDNVVAGTYY